MQRNLPSFRFGLATIMLMLGLTHALPATTAHSAKPSDSPSRNTTLQRETNLDCLPERSHIRPFLSDCAIALTKLPESPDTVMFYKNGPPYGRYGLPISFESGRCRATLSINSAEVEDSASWVAIHAIFQDILFTCTLWYERGIISKPRTGGSVTGVGAAGRLIVAFDKISRGSDDKEEKDDEGDYDSNNQSETANATIANNIVSGKTPQLQTPTQ